ncbi:DNA-methyltransferase [candidate division CSSED10-310 bacterium]|uniref:Methyltransferase n=1 Tax=candidate division CSSED10-310 bacterium TaxID=2855610 RepID=A0ABV6YRM8_UNCC1
MNHEPNKIELKKNFMLPQGDTSTLIKQIPDDSIDLLLTDPPYNLRQYSTGNINMSWRRNINNDLEAWDETEFQPHDWLADFKRIIKNSGNIFVFTSYNLIGKWHAAFDPEFDTFQFMVWHKTNPTPKVYKTSFLNSCELIVCVWNKGHTWNFISQKEMHNFIETPICMGNERVKNPRHPTQKPVRVLKHIINIASNENDVVFDPFMGVGSTGVAALEMERKFIGFESNQAYCEAAEKRLQNVSSPSFEP